MGQALDWTQEKGNPFDYKKTYEDFTKDSEYKIKKEMPDVPKIMARIKMNIPLYSMHTIEELSHANLVHNMYEDSAKLDKHLNAHDAITIYLDYPLGKIVEITSYAIRRTFEEQSERRYFFTVGQIAWEIAKIYADIYQNKWEKVGVWGHGLSDLHLEEIQIRDGNILTIYVGS